MSIFSKTCEYALRAVFYIASQTVDGSKVGIREIAKNVDSPEHFLGKILQDLSRKGIIDSTKGPNGGFYVTGQSLKRPIADIVSAVDGNDIFTGCAMGLTYCSETTPCPLHHEFKKIRNQITKMLTGTTIGQFNKDLLLGKILLRKV